MMKKFLFGCVALCSLLWATSCKPEDENLSLGNEATVRFSISRADVSPRRTIADATGVNTLVYEVYDAKGNKMEAISDTKPNAFQNGLTETVEFRLAKGQMYSFAFFAYNNACGDAYDVTELQHIKISYKGATANDEKRDAFFGQLLKQKVEADFTQEVTLKRPFAQLNYGVQDVADAEKLGIVVKQSSLTITNVATGFNALTGAIVKDDAAPTSVKFDLADIPTETFTVEDQSYSWLSMNYILVNDATTGSAVALSDVTLTLAVDQEKNTAAQDYEIKSPNTPLRRNYRTNLLGSLTNTGTFTVTLDPNFDGDNHYDAEKITVVDEAKGVRKMGEDTYLFDKPEALQWMNEQLTATMSATSFKGQTILLNTDIDFSTELIDHLDGIGGAYQPGDIKAFEGTFDGQGHAIKGAKLDNQYRYGNGLFARVTNGVVKNITLENVEVTNTKPGGANIYGIVAGYTYGKTLIENVHVKNCKIAGFGKVGGLVGMANVGGHLTLRNCSVTDTEIRGVYNVANFVGLVQSDITIADDCYFSNITPIIDEDKAKFEEGIVEWDQPLESNPNIQAKGKYQGTKFTVPNDSKYGDDAGKSFYGWYSTYAIYYNRYLNGISAIVRGVLYKDLPLEFDAIPCNTRENLDLKQGL